jgi:hypothetical protein
MQESVCVFMFQCMYASLSLSPSVLPATGTSLTMTVCAATTM